MYPILSTLRRAATSYIYVRRDMLVEKDGVLHVRLETPTNRLLLLEACWDSKSESLIPVDEVVVSALSSEEAAISMAKRENDISQGIRAEEAIYTLILGPEQEDTLEGRVVRRCRYAAVRGVYRAHGSKGLEAVQAKNTKKSVYTQTRTKAIRLD